MCHISKEPTPLQDKLTGALIGLARATDGNEHLISPSSTGAVVAGLMAAVPGACPEDAALEAMLKRVEEEKRKMVPDCFTCASPCGKNSDYEMRDLRSAPEDVRKAKLEILSGIQSIAAHYAPEHEKLLYRALIAIGIDDFGLEELQPIAQEVRDAIPK